MNPLTGIYASRGNALGYRYASPDGDGFPVTYSVTHFHTDHSSLITVHSSHTFSAKEKDSETGFSYFGSRYYSSDLSVWLSVDPQASKYPSLSPYVYCADNPIKLVDPNGEEIVLCFYLGKNGESSSKLLAKIIDKGLEGQFKTKFTKNKDGKYALSLTPTENGGDVSKMSAEAKAFYEELSSMINDHNTVATIDVVYGSKDVTIGNYQSNKIDIADIDQYDNMGEGLCSKQGKLIHELVEQFGKAKDGVPKGSNDNYQKNHKKGIVSENKINGSIRGQDRYDRGVYKTTYTKKERSTTYSYSVSEPIIKVNKSW